ncbi:MAG: efflux RND transporter periplasmic adaptor subunit [bacterium]|nr:efflux RND transporter periplasmic adaptor subunit [bacterium]
MRFLTTGIFAAISMAMLGLSGCRTGNGWEASPRTITVGIQEVRQSSSEMDIAYCGTIEEALTVPLTFAVLGTVSEVHVHEGDRVRQGDLLATLNTETWRNSYEMATAKLTQAEDAYRRLKPMHESGSLPAIKWVEVETGLHQAEAAAAVAKKSLADCSLRATVDGIVGRRSIEPGMGANPALSAITLVRIDTVYAKISVAESEIAVIKKGMKSTVSVSALGKTRLAGVVEQVGVMADPLMHTYRVKIAIPNEDHTLLPGMLCNVWILDPRRPAAVVVPTGSVMVDESGRHYLFIADTVKSVARRREVTPALFVNTGVELTSGVEAGEWIIVSGQQKLSDQSPIHFTR